MTKLFLDTATSDLWKYGRDIPDTIQPHLVRLAWLLEDDDGRTIRDASHLICLPQGMQMASEAAHYTGIYDQNLEQRGLRLFEVLSEFAKALGQSDLVVAHALTSHKQVVDRSFRYVSMPSRDWPPGLDAMIKATDLVQVPAMQPGRQWKWPSYDACCEKLVGHRYMPTTDPVADGMTRVHYVRIFHQNIVRAGLDQPTKGTDNG